MTKRKKEFIEYILACQKEGYTPHLGMFAEKFCISRQSAYFTLMSMHKNGYIDYSDNKRVKVLRNE